MDPKIQQTEEQSTGLRESSPEFLLYTNHSIYEKSLIWEVFLAHISVHYSI